MNTPRLATAIHSALAAALLLIVLVFVWTLLIQPAISARLQMQERYQSLVSEVKRFGGMATIAPMLRNEIEALQTQGQNDPALLQDADESRANASVQSRIQELASKHHAVLKSIQPTSAPTGIPFVGVTMRVEMQGTLVSLLNVLIELPNSRPVLHLDNLHIRPQRPGAARQDSPAGDLLDIRFDATGYLQIAGAQ